MADRDRRRTRRRQNPMMPHSAGQALDPAGQQQPDPQPMQRPTWWRTVLGEYPTGVAIITSLDHTGQPVGMVVGTFNAVSQDPPLVGFMPSADSYTFGVIRSTGRFRVSVLGAGHENMCRAFFTGSPERRFDTGNWVYGEDGIPRLADAVAWFDAAVDAVHAAGDHAFVLGAVDDFGVGDGHAGLPLIFLKGGYGSFSVPHLEFDLREFGGRLRRADEFRDVLAELAKRLDVECSLTTVVRDSVVILTTANLRSHHTASTHVGASFPFAAPLAPVFSAWCHPERRDLWIENSRHLLGSVDRPLLADMIERVRTRGYAISIGSAMADSFDHIIGNAATDRARLKSLWAQVRDDYVIHASREPWDADVSSIQAPVFGPDRTAELELVVQGFDTKLTERSFNAIVRSTLEVTGRLSTMIGGDRT